MKIFSRNQEDNTGKYPDIISRIPKVGVCHPLSPSPPAGAAVTAARSRGGSRPARCSRDMGLCARVSEFGFKWSVGLESYSRKRTFVSPRLPFRLGLHLSPALGSPFCFQIKLPSVTSFILDAEAVAWDREKKQIQPFQVLTTRKRKVASAPFTACHGPALPPLRPVLPTPQGVRVFVRTQVSASAVWLPQLQPLHPHPSRPSRKQEELFSYISVFCFFKIYFH